MVSNNTPYMNRVPVQIGTLHICEAVKLATKEEKKALPVAWETTNFPPQVLVKASLLQEPKFDLCRVDSHE